MKKRASRKRKAQTWSIEVFMAIMVFLIATVMFYAIIYTTPKTKELNKEAELITKSVDSDAIFQDGILTQDEAQALTGKSCNDLKIEFNTNKKICVYFKNQQGEIVPLSGDMPVVGCEGIKIGNVECKSAPSCDDSILNQDETDVDCGGSICSPCALGLNCKVHIDCAGAKEATTQCSTLTKKCTPLLG